MESPLSAPALAVLAGLPRIGAVGWAFTTNGRARIPHFSNTQWQPSRRSAI
jgi:hypothetical protein